ncbi:MAG: hypothetical protein AUK47_09295 [Deltaproteobacteria bacterium CG2_30_63_29]|nr:MAG: hypothetical protein AUK47_09295 [Deltaproteobacteria bacterium CG2_30_63_29]PJB37607.1 MAG: hypothetical protein CO108_20805 [Deltaproteobacteria bacterium CG_4_9_14_3_um_filter_63_12]
MKIAGFWRYFVDVASIFHYEGHEEHEGEEGGNSLFVLFVSFVVNSKLTSKRPCSQDFLTPFITRCRYENRRVLAVYC